MTKNPTRPVRAICAAVVTAAIGVFLTLVNTTQSVGRAFGLNYPFVYWATQKPFACVGWIFEADKRHLWYAAHHLRYPPQYSALLAFHHKMLIEGIESTAVVALAVLAAGVLAEHLDRKRADFRSPRRLRFPGGKPPFSLHLGTATGRLLAIGHGSGVSANEPLTLVGDDAAKNTAAFGGTGSGKSTGITTPIMTQALAQDAGMFVFDVKGDAGDEFIFLARCAKRSVTVIGTRRDGGRPCNLLHGLTPEMSASFLKSAFLLAGNTGGNSAYWVDQATELARAVLGVLSFFPEHYSLHGLHEYVFKAAFRARLKPRIAERFIALMDTRTGNLDEADRLTTYASYFTTIFMPIEPKTRSIILTQLATVLSPFTLPELRQAFCEPHPENVDLTRVVAGDAILVRLPLARYGLGAKTAYTLLKLRFFNVMNCRRLEPSWNQERYVVFVCDEYQEIVSVAKDGLSDLNFWDKSRSSGCVGVIAAQGYSSFRAAIGNDSLTASFLQNFRQQITFQTEDEATIRHFVYLLGQVEVEREARSQTRSQTRSRRAGGVSTGTSTARAMQSTIDPQTIRNLAPGEALAVLSIGGAAYDDVIVTAAPGSAQRRTAARGNAARRSGAVA